MVLSKVFKRDSRVERFDPEKVKVAIFKAFKAVKKASDEDVKMSAGQVVLRLQRKFEHHIPKVEEIQDTIEQVLMDYNFPEVAKAFILYRQKQSEAREAKKLAGVKDELKLSVNAAVVLEKRYLKKNDKGEAIETPKQMMERVAKNIAGVEAKHGKSKKQVDEIYSKFYGMMSKFEFLPNSPTLMNAGNELQQLSACFVLPVQDSLDSIFDAVKNAAIIQQSGGGTGFNFSHLRHSGDVVKSTMGAASGPISFIRVFDSVTEVVKQGSRRRGANMGVLNFSHPDILEFATAKQKPGAFENFNFSVAVSDEFMKKATGESKQFDLISPRTGKPVKKAGFKEVFGLLTTMAWETGDPGLLFIDEMNKRNPLKKLGLIETTNPCGEVDLLPFESCNLGSINLTKMVKGKSGKKQAAAKKLAGKKIKPNGNGTFEAVEFDWKKFEDTVKLAVRFLDNVIDATKFPLKQSEEITKANRKIGLGVMGFADLLTMLEIPYNSSRALGFADKLMRFLQKTAEKASFELAKERGSFSNFEKSAWKKKYKKFRNGTVSAIAPTGTISIIAGCSSGIEPLFAVSFVRNIMNGTQLLEVNSQFEKVAKAEGFYSRDLMIEIARKGSIQSVHSIPEKWRRVFATAFDITPEDHVKMQGVFQKYCDNSVSKTINLPHSASPEDVKKVYLLAWKLKCKGITVYRYGSKPGQVLSLGEKDDKLPHENVVTAGAEFAGGCPIEGCVI